MAYFTKEQIIKAKEVDLYSYLKSYDPEELVYDSKDTYTTRTHDSLKINNGMWYWFSRGIGGKTALEYLIKVRNYKFIDAVSLLLDKEIPKQNTSYILETINKEFILPLKDSTNKDIISYLHGRGISLSIIDECINRGLIYQDIHKNVVFLGYDNNCYQPRYAGIRGTNNTRFMHDIYGSNKAYSFRLEAICKNDSLHLFESAIDLLSFATLKEINKEHWDEENLLSLAGIYNPKNNKTPQALTVYLQNHSNINKIILHFDNDKAGILASKGIVNALSDRYKVIVEPIRYGKDVNDYLCYKLKINKNLNENYAR